MLLRIESGELHGQIKHVHQLYTDIFLFTILLQVNLFRV